MKPNGARRRRATVWNSIARRRRWRASRHRSLGARGARQYRVESATSLLRLARARAASRCRRPTGARWGRPVERAPMAGYVERPPRAPVAVRDFGPYPSIVIGYGAFGGAALGPGDGARRRQAPSHARNGDDAPPIASPTARLRGRAALPTPAPPHGRGAAQRPSRSLRRLPRGASSKAQRRWPEATAAVEATLATATATADGDGIRRRRRSSCRRTASDEADAGARAGRRARRCCARFWTARGARDERGHAT